MYFEVNNRGSVSFFIHIFYRKGDANSSKDLPDENGDVKQRRYYDENGDADLGIDYHHGGVGHNFPHRHYWNNGVRDPEMPY